jgi:hypothetical protein
MVLPVTQDSDNQGMDRCVAADAVGLRTFYSPYE